MSGLSKTSSALSAAAAAAIAAGPVIPGQAVDTLNGIRKLFDTNFKPECTQFLVHPPTDERRLRDEHRRLTERLLAQVLLKLDAVDTSGQELARKYRKELVNQVNAMLTMLDEAIGK